MVNGSKVEFLCSAEEGQDARMGAATIEEVGVSVGYEGKNFVGEGVGAGTIGGQKTLVGWGGLAEAEDGEAWRDGEAVGHTHHVHLVEKLGAGHTYGLHHSLATIGGLGHLNREAPTFGIGSNEDFGTWGHRLEGTEASAMVVVAMADNHIVGLAQVDAEGLCIVD